MTAAHWIITAVVVAVLVILVGALIEAVRDAAPRDSEEKEQ